jgi:hypothetical protein
MQHHHAFPQTTAAFWIALVGVQSVDDYCCRQQALKEMKMMKFLPYLLPLLLSGAALADEVKDAPIPTEMNWFGIIAFAVVFFGLTIGFIVAVFVKSRGKQADKKPQP